MKPTALFQQILSFQNRYVELLPLGLQHVEGLLPLALDPSLWAFTRSQVRNEDELTEYVDLAVAERRACQSYPFIIMDRTTKTAAGCTRFCNFSWVDKRVEIGFTWLGKPYQRTALNRATKFELLRFAFEKLEMERVEFKTDSRNQASRNGLLGIGAREEGILRSHLVNWDGHRRDTVYFSILKAEWPDRSATEFRFLKEKEDSVLMKEEFPD
jgi:N-acetyltransferase